MGLEIHFFRSIKELNRPFISASGKLEKKEIIQVLFLFNHEIQFIYELALSPSLGEMPVDIWNSLKDLPSKTTLDAFNSKHVQRAISYYLNRKNFKSKIPKKKHLTIRTYSLGERVDNIPKGTIVKLKGAPSNMAKIVEFSRRKNKINWIVDFNRSLNSEELTLFLNEANLKNCLFIEQPLPNGQIFKFPKTKKVSFWADEELEDLSPKEFISSPYEGFILKYMRHSCEELMTWVSFARDHNRSFMFGDMACDIVGSEFTNVLSNYFCEHELVKNKYQFFKGAGFDEDIYRFGDGVFEVNPAVTSFLNRGYELVYPFMIF